MAFEKEALVKLCVDGYKGNVTQYSVGEVSEVIRKEFIELMGTDKPNPREFRAHAPQIYAILEEVLDDLITKGITQTRFFDQFVEYRDLNLGDRNEFYVEDRTTLFISEVAHGHWNLRRQKLNVGQSFHVDTKVYGAAVYGDFLRFVTGRLDWAGLVNKLQEAVQLKLAEDIYTGFLGATQYLPTQFKKTGSFDANAMSDLIQHVSVANNYKPLVIAGTRNALKKITGSYTGTPFMASQNMLDILNQQGYLNVFDGVPLLEIPQVFKRNTFDFKLDDNVLMVLATDNKPVKVVREGQSMIKEVSSGTENLDMSIEHMFLTQYGVATVFNNAYGVYTVS